ncbi:7858_t:CDS:10 [Paraglomus occultum]|uniref:Glutamate decarboxylase n=1 Tax=Paraglomus occultum TaxID=144539 RepID=A0A9N9FWY2_9GLOM|nr:7858_t:CDS:10 [Paraglomus occultum]
MVFLSNAISNSKLEGKDECTESDQTEEVYSSTVYGSRWSDQPIPRFELPEDEMPPHVAYKLIKDDLAVTTESALDSKPTLNLASFVTTYMEEEAEKLMYENISKNFIDFEEYPMSVEIQNRCVNIIARLFHAPVDNPNQEAMGVSTVGSSEAIMLAVLAMKRRWQEQRRAKGLSTDKPNLVMGSNVQVCWEKACRYFEVEENYVYCSEGQYILSPEKAVELVNENTIGVCVILGSTYTGHYEDVKAVNDLLLVKKALTGWEVPIHVDAASGGFVAPFVNPDLEWDFRLPLVKSINVSGHKYGLCYPGIGWAIWRSAKYLPKDLVFTINYLGADQASFTLNFSKGASHVIAQYYVLIRLGRKGFTSIMKNITKHADRLAQMLEATERFEILSERNGKGLPVVAFRLKHNEKMNYDEFDLATRLRERGWVVPAYTMAPHAEHIKLLRVVLREDFTRIRCELLMKDIKLALSLLDKMDRAAIKTMRSASQRWTLLKHATLAFKGHKNQTDKTYGVC